MNNHDFLIERDHRLINSLKEIIKHLHVLVISGMARGELRFEVESVIQLTDNILKSETTDLKPSTLRLKDAINQALLENKDGDGVVVTIFKDQHSKFSKCSQLKIVLNGSK